MTLEFGTKGYFPKNIYSHNNTFILNHKKNFSIIGATVSLDLENRNLDNVIHIHCDKESGNKESFDSGTVWREGDRVP